jgi:hypothetical protein
MKLALVSALSFRRVLVFGLQPFDRDTLYRRRNTETILQHGFYLE